MLKHLFPSKSRVAIISLFLLDEFKGSIRGIAKKAKCSPMQARKELDNLEKIGLLKSEKLGNAKIYSLNEKCPFLDELRALVVKTTGFEIQLNSVLNKIKGIEMAFIYGSYAVGDFKGKSDIDLFIIGTPDMKKLNSIIFRIQRKIGREINVVVYPKKEFMKRRHYGFIKNVLANKKVFLIGDEHELG